ncbi:MAG TPA: PaaI family thioesterase [Acidimicrobiales bacterium]|nr:PaaI family thioesterase [Acidimicrobiales bacterium]
MTVPPAVVTADELNEFLRDAFPGAPRGYGIEAVTELGVRLRAPIGPENQRPGGTVSGPTMMSLADAGAWFATLSRVGIVPLAVTSTLTINFLHKPELVDLVADAELLRLGARSSLTEVRIFSGDGGPLVAQATVGYSIPS